MGLPPPRWSNHNKRWACQMHNTDELIEICCREQTPHKREITASLRCSPPTCLCVWLALLMECPPSTPPSLADVRFSKDLNAFFFSVITQVRKSLIAKKVCFLFPIEKKKENPRVNSYKVARKAIMALGRGREVCAVLRRDR